MSWKAFRNTTENQRKAKYYKPKLFLKTNASDVQNFTTAVI